MLDKVKILFWTDAFLLHYCLAHTIQQKTNAKIYGIFDVTDRLKPFFQKQDLVEYSEKWFYHDNISSKNIPNLEYLENFEKKYNIKLWTLAINERIFLQYNPFYKFNKNEILSIIESECRFFEKILDEINPKYLVTLDPGLHHGHLLTQMCKSRSIPVLMLNISKFPHLCYISQSIHTLDEKLEKNDDQNFSFEQLQELLLSNNLSTHLEKLYSKMRKSKIAKLKAGLEVFLNENSNINTHFTYYGRSKTKLLVSELKQSQETKKRKKFLDNNSLTDIINKKFIYFPLNQEPERSLLIDAPYFTNQIETVRHIAKSIPIDYVLYVKEHPTQGKARGWRPISDYQKILDLPNVSLIHPDVSSIELIKNSSLVITSGGSASFEAPIFKKPSIMLGNLGFKEMGIHTIKSVDELPDKIHFALDSTVNLKQLSTYISTLLKNSFEFDFFGFQIRSGNTFFYNENLVDVEISEKDMEKFLDSEKSNLELLAMKHIEKIESYEKI